jgi:hypothetical protein
MKKVAILQSNYIPWKGYFDLIGRVDEFILYDEMQYTKNDWRNRNKIKTSNGVNWITIPVRVNSLHQKINETKVPDKLWATKHLKTLKINYSKAACFKECEDWLTELYEQVQNEEFLSNINYNFIIEICNLLNIKTKISWSTDYKLIEGKTERLVDLCQQAGATVYMSGPAAKDYIQPKLFEEANIKLLWMDYTGYPEYNQLYPPFVHPVSLIDLILNEGRNAPAFLKSMKQKL